MNRTDRLLAIVLELQGKRWQRADDLARTFETSKRTIYRDIQALGQAGVPVVSIPGRGYSLVEGYFLPPLSFSVEEATMLLLGADAMAQSFDAQYRAAAESATRKIAGVLPEQIGKDVAALRESVHIIAGDAAPQRADRLQLLQRLRGAILARRRIRFRYFTRHSATGTAGGIETGELREADPYSLARVSGAWYLAAYCHTRNDQRTFRLDRMEALDVLDATFARPASYRLPYRTPGTSGDIRVRALFAPEVARWVRESPSFFAVSEEETPDGLLVTFAVRTEDELLNWLLGWGRHVRVLEPESLRARIAGEAQAMASIHGTQGATGQGV